MTSTLTDEQYEIRDLAHDFASRELRPHTARWDEERRVDDSIFRDLAELGFLGMVASDSEGGLGFDPLTYLLVIEELAWGDAAVALRVAIHNAPVLARLLESAAEDLKKVWIPRLVVGDVVGSVADVEWSDHYLAPSSEPSAQRGPGGWHLRGRVWAAGISDSSVLLVSARRAADTAPARVLVPPGLAQISTDATPMGLRAAGLGIVELDGVVVDGDALIAVPADGAEGERSLGLSRLGAAAVALGIGRAAMEHAISYSAERKQFDQPISQFGAIRQKLASMAGRLASARALAHEAGRLLERRPDRGRHAETGSSSSALAKLAACEAAVWVADEAIQIFGGYGYMREYPVEKLLRDAQGLQTVAGAPERLGESVARDLLSQVGPEPLTGSATGAFETR